MFEHWRGKNELFLRLQLPSAEERLKAYEVAEKFYERFEAQNGSVFCRELIGYDLSDSEQRIRAREANVFDEKCAVFIRTAVEILVGLVQDES